MMISRRGFLAAGAAFGIGGVAFGQSRARQIAAGAKIRVALIGCGARMGQIIEPIMAEQVVALADPDPKMRAHLLGRMAKMPHAKEYDLSKVRTFADYRELFAKMGDEIDAVFIATPNHHHALAAVMAMRRGIHVFVEKPMASTVQEAQFMGRVAKETGVVTQVGNFGHSTKAMRICVDSIKKGLIGEIRDVWCYDDRINSMMYRPPAAPPPKGMDWDVWCGPAPKCDYYAPTKDHNGMHPHDWHSWIGYGNGSIGNMGTHIMDAAFWALELGKVVPDKVDVKDVAWGCAGAWAKRDSIDFHFPSRGNLPPVTLHWRDGMAGDLPMDSDHFGPFINEAKKRAYLNFPPELLEFERKWNLAKAPLAFMGSVFIGTKGAIWHCFHSSLRFFPKTLGKEIRKNKAGYQANEHVMEFLNAVRAHREANTNFDYSVPLAKILMLGNATARAGVGEYAWDGHRFTCGDKANRFLKTVYRKGWEL